MQRLTLALTYRIETNRVLRRWAWLSRAALFGATLLSDVAVILTMSWLTGVAYHLAVYGTSGDLLSFLEVGALSAVLFIVFNAFRGEYTLQNYFSLKSHLRHAVQLWNMTFICLLAVAFLTQVSAVYSRGWMVLYYGSTTFVLIAVRFLSVKMTGLAARNGLISTRRIFLFGAGGHIEDFVTRYQPRNFGVNVVGCHFLTPTAPDVSAQSRREMLANDLAAAIASVRVLRPDAVFLVMSWSDRDMINWCAERLLSAPS